MARVSAPPPRTPHFHSLPLFSLPAAPLLCFQPILPERLGNCTFRRSQALYLIHADTRATQHTSKNCAHACSQPGSGLLSFLVICLQSWAHFKENFIETGANLMPQSCSCTSSSSHSIPCYFISCLTVQCSAAHSNMPH